MGYGRHVGRVGALAVALGIGTALVTTPGIAFADEGTSSGADKGVKSSDVKSNDVDSNDVDSNDVDSNPIGDTTNDPITGTPNEGPSLPSHVGTKPDQTASSGTGPGTSIGTSGGPKVILNAQTTIDTGRATHTATPPVRPQPPVIAVSDPPVSVPTSPVIPPTTLRAADPTTVTTPAAGSHPPVTKTGSPSDPLHGAGLTHPNPTPPPKPAPSPKPVDPPSSIATTHVTRVSVESDLDAPGTSNQPQTNTFRATVFAPTLPEPTVPPPTPADTLLALPGAFVSTALNLVTQALAPIFGPGAPGDNPVLWTMLAFVRRQFNQGFANSAPVLAPQQTSQDLDDAQVHGTFGGTDADGDTLSYTVPTTGLGAPAHGEVTIDQAGGTYTYTPEAGYVGEDYFFVTATDDTAAPHIHALGQTHLVAARVDVTVAPPEITNQPPDVSILPPGNADPRHRCGRVRGECP